MNRFVAIASFRHSCRALMAAALAICVFAGVASATAQLDGIAAHGFASQGYTGSDHYNYLNRSSKGSFEFSEYAVNLSRSLSDELHVGVQFFARDLGELGNLQIDLDWAFGDFRKKDWLGIRAGRVKMPYGLYNETADFDAARTSVLLPQSVYDLRLRDLLVAVNGISPYGSVEMGGAGSIDYTGYAGTVGADRSGSVARFFNDSGPITFASSDNEAAWGGSVIWNTPWVGLRFGHSINRYRGSFRMTLDPGLLAMLAPLGAQAVETLRYDDVVFHVSSGEFSWNNLVVSGEYATWKGTFTNAFIGTDMNWEKFYGQASWRVNEFAEVGAYYSVHYDDKDDRAGKAQPVDFMGWQKDLALSARFDVTQNMLFKVEAHRLDGIAQVFTLDNPEIASAPGSLEPNWWYLAAKISFVY